MKSGELANPTKLPAWAVTVIALVVFIYIGIFLGGVNLIFVAKNILQRAIDPNKIRLVARDIAKFPEPLPRDYQYKLGLDLGPLKMVTIEHEPDHQLILLVGEIGLEDADNEAGTVAQAVIKRMYDGGVNIPTTGRTISAHFLSQKKQGELMLAHEKMHYLVGDLIDTENKKMEGSVGCILLRSAKKITRTILVYALQPDGQLYSLDETLRLLSSVSEF